LLRQETNSIEIYDDSLKLDITVTGLDKLFASNSSCRTSSLEFSLILLQYVLVL
jgi:hypothetical protein